MKIISVVGARPQFIKIAPLCRELVKFPDIKHYIVHTGQHYDYMMSKVFFDELQIPEPDYILDVGSGTHGHQTGDMLRKCEDVFLKEKPDWIIVFGDTNSTVAGALAAAKLHLPLGHVESGLRSRNRFMPEEINRILTDHCSDILFCPTEHAVSNLRKEGFCNIFRPDQPMISSRAKQLAMHRPDLPLVFNVGDIMYDALLFALQIAEKKSRILEKLKLKPRGYFLATVHRSENTDNPERIRSIFKSFREISRDCPVITPLHPRTRKALTPAERDSFSDTAVQLIAPVGYFDMLVLEKNARRILTDSGGIQKEAYFLQVPCVTLRDETEWAETVSNGWNTVVGADVKKITAAAAGFQPDSGQPACFGDGRACEKIVEILRNTVRT